MVFATRRLALLLGPLLIGGGVLAAHAQQGADPTGCSGDNGGLTLPPGFCATVFADGLGHTRHLAVAADGTVYVNTWSGRYFRAAPPAPEGAFLIGLKDRDGDGMADVIERFGPTSARGGTGGTGIALYKDALYAEAGDSVVRYPLTPGQIAPSDGPVTIVSGLPLSGDHPMHPIAIDTRGTLFINSGSATNACESPNRQPGAKGQDPCEESKTRAGIWAYRADRPGQVFSPAERWATGIRNTGGIAFDAAGRMFAVQHGRDQLAQNWPALYTTEQGVERPAEVLFSPYASSDFGWPYCYYDGIDHRLVLAPEFGGDGGKTQGRCAGKAQPLAPFPAHWAPNDLAIYTGTAFPTAYHGGAFIAFHGSWNRAPAPQDGYIVVFQPMRDGKPNGAWTRFADGFAGAFKEPGRAVHRPAGLAVGPDGALYVADDVRGRIWRVTWHGGANAPLVSAPPPALPAEPAPKPVTAASPGLPAGFSAQQVALGKAIYLGEAKGGTCAGCHGSDGHGSAAGAALTGPAFLWSDGSVEGIARVIAAGVAQPKVASGAMPARGGAAIDDQDVRAVAAYVWTLGHGAS